MQHAASSGPSSSFGPGSSSASLRIKLSKGLRMRSPTKKGPVVPDAAADRGTEDDFASHANDHHHLQTVCVTTVATSSPVQEGGMEREEASRNGPLAGLLDIAAAELQRSHAIGRRAVGGLHRRQGDLQMPEDSDDILEEQEPELDDVLNNFSVGGSELSMDFQVWAGDHAWWQMGILLTEWGGRKEATIGSG